MRRARQRTGYQVRFSTRWNDNRGSLYPCRRDGTSSSAKITLMITLSLSLTLTLPDTTSQRQNRTMRSGKVDVISHFQCCQIETRFLFRN